MKVIYNGEYKLIDNTGKKFIYKHSSDIPSSYKDKIFEIEIEEGVTSIPKRAFERCESITNITIPNSVSVIGEKAFFGCYKLKEIKLPDNITQINSQVFSWCAALEAIQLFCG